MASIQRSIPPINPQTKRNDSRPADLVAEARERLLECLRTAAAAVNLEVFRLETTGDLADNGIEKAFEAVCWAVDHFREEQEIAAMEADFAGQPMTDGFGSTGTAVIQ